MNSRLLRRISGLPLIGIFAIALSACGGSGSGGDNGNEPPPTGETVSVSGRISFDRIPFNAGADSGLDVANPVESPAREVIVEAIDSTSNVILAATTTDDSGDYVLNVPVNRNVFIRAKAQMLKDDAAPTWNFRVMNNTNSDALYALDSSVFNSGTGDSTRNLHAATGWEGSSYTGTRAAAPFAILDTVYEAKELVLSADENTAFPELNLFWSSENRTTIDALCADSGDIGTTFYQGPGEDVDDCDEQFPSGIYILGAFAAGGGDTDEFDQHVIAHEFGHYYEDQFSRSDSIGGEHGEVHLLDMRVAFGEGWGNAYSGMSLNDPVYRDSYSGIDSDFDFDLESDSTTLEGWFSEFSVSEIIWDIYDGGTESGDTVALGFGPIHDVMTGSQVTTEALTSIYTFIDALRDQNAGSASGINALLSNEQIVVNGEFAEGETNDAGGDPAALPIYTDIAAGGQASVCTHASDDGSWNKVGNSRFLRFTNGASRPVTIQAAGAPDGAGTVPADDPEIFIYDRGTVVSSATQEGPTDTVSQLPLEAGIYVIEVYDFGIIADPDDSIRCITVSITG